MSPNRSLQIIYELMKIQFQIRAAELHRLFVFPLEIAYFLFPIFVFFFYFHHFILFLIFKLFLIFYYPLLILFLVVLFVFALRCLIIVELWSRKTSHTTEDWVFWSQQSLSKAWGTFFSIYFIRIFKNPSPKNYLNLRNLYKRIGCCITT